MSKSLLDFLNTVINTRPEKMEVKSNDTELAEKKKIALGYGVKLIIID